MRTDPHSESQGEGRRRVLWFVALWAAGVLVFGAVTLLFRMVMG